MYKVRNHLVNTWANDGLQCGASGLGYICAQVGPKFPIGVFCADVSDLFDAEVVAQTDSTGLTLRITVPDPSPPTTSSWLKWVKFAFVAIIVPKCIYDLMF